MSTNYRDPLIDFEGIPWESPGPGVRLKSTSRDGQPIRLIEFSKGFVENDWCHTGHIGFVIEGSFNIEFEGGDIPFKAGDAIHIQPGKASKHRARAPQEKVTLFVIDIPHPEKTSWKLRVADRSDIPRIGELIPRSSFALQKETYTPKQVAAALGHVFGVDPQLIDDGTYYVVEEDGEIIGCGGWSFRKSLFGGNEGRSEPDPELDPKTDASRIRAFFIDPDHARKGIATAIMHQCEDALIAMGFERVEISATLVGEQFYSKFGYTSVENYEIPLEGAEPMEVVKMTKTIDTS